MDHGFKLDSDEQIVRHIYHHWIDIATTATMSGIMVLVGLVLVYGFARYRDMLPGFLTVASVGALALVFFALAALILIFGMWIYRRNYLLLTNKHLIQVEQHGLFTNQVDQVSLGRIQDVSGKQPGMLATILGYGTVTIQSAGEARQFIFPRTPGPQELADSILEAHEQFLAKHGQGPAD